MPKSPRAEGHGSRRAESTAAGRGPGHRPAELAPGGEGAPRRLREGRAEQGGGRGGVRAPHLGRPGRTRVSPCGPRGRVPWAQPVLQACPAHEPPSSLAGDSPRRWGLPRHTWAAGHAEAGPGAGVRAACGRCAASRAARAERGLGPPVGPSVRAGVGGRKAWVREREGASGGARAKDPLGTAGLRPGANPRRQLRPHGPRWGDSWAQPHEGRGQPCAPVVLPSQPGGHIPLEWPSQGGPAAPRPARGTPWDAGRGVAALVTGAGGRREGDTEDTDSVCPAVAGRPQMPTQAGTPAPIGSWSGALGDPQGLRHEAAGLPLPWPGPAQTSVGCCGRRDHSPQLAGKPPGGCPIRAVVPPTPGPVKAPL